MEQAQTTQEGDTLEKGGLVLFWRSLLCINLTPFLLLPLGIYVAHYIPSAIMVGLGWLCSMAFAVWIKPKARGLAWASFGLRVWVTLIPIALVLPFGAVPWLRMELGLVEVIDDSARADVSRLGASTGWGLGGHKTLDYNRKDHYAIVMPLVNQSAEREEGKEVWAIASKLGPGTEDWRKKVHQELIEELGQKGEWLIDHHANKSDPERLKWAPKALAHARARLKDPSNKEVLWASIEVPKVDRSSERAWTLWVWGLTNLLFILWWSIRLRGRLDPQGSRS